jgi:multisubunit Na+/H+ antiporter MnhG subunit
MMIGIINIFGAIFIMGGVIGLIHIKRFHTNFKPDVFSIACIVIGSFMIILNVAVM